MASAEPVANRTRACHRPLTRTELSGLGSPNPKFFHARTQGARVDAEDFRCADAIPAKVRENVLAFLRKNMKRIVAC
mgnify:CR=1 FL=1